jgi:hypothetical protein
MPEHNEVSWLGRLSGGIRYLFAMRSTDRRGLGRDSLDAHLNVRVALEMQMTTRTFVLVAALSPALLVVGFVESARIWPGELRKNIELTLIAGVLLVIGCLSANEPWRAWAGRLLAFAIACAAWHVLLARTVYRGLMKDEDMSVATVARLLGAYAFVAGGAFGVARLAQWAVRAASRRLTG